MNRKQMLVIDRGVPTFDQDSGSLRMYSLLKLLTGLHYAVTFYPMDQIPREPYTEILKKQGIQVVFQNLAAYLKSKGAFFSFVLLSRPDETFQSLPYVRNYAVNSKVIYDTVDIHWVRCQRGAALQNDETLSKQADHFRAIETINALSSDLTLTVTEQDKTFLLEALPDIAVEVIPNIHPPDKTLLSFHDRKDLLFIGGFHHQPNVDAVLYFAEKIFPLIQQKIPGVRFHVVGSHPPPSITALTSSDINVTGYVKDVRPYFNNCRVFVSPLRYGAGMKGKIGQSMAHGLPVVTTDIGAEGMSLVSEQNALVVNDPGPFADAVARVYQNENLWRTLSENSIKHIEKNFSPGIVRRKLEMVLNSLEKESINLPSFYHFSLAPKATERFPRPLPSTHTLKLSGGSVLVVGVYLADKKNTIEHLVDEFSRSRTWKVTQRWAAIGQGLYPYQVSSKTVWRVEQGLPKYAMINQLLVNERLDSYDFILVCDDDITLPPDFLDTFLEIQTNYDFALAQPARTHNSYIDHVIVEKMDGLQARRTRFNEIGPLNSFRRDALKLLFPFDVSITPMGWGYDFVWPLILEQNDLNTGIIDATAVDHSLRKPVSYYNHPEAQRQMADYLAATPHLSIEEAFTVLESFP